MSSLVEKSRKEREDVAVELKTFSSLLTDARHVRFCSEIEIEMEMEMEMKARMKMEMGPVLGQTVALLARMGKQYQAVWQMGDRQYYFLFCCTCSARQTVGKQEIIIEGEKERC